jgi:hypothetical protein
MVCGKEQISDVRCNYGIMYDKILCHDFIRTYHTNYLEGWFY